MATYFGEVQELISRAIEIDELEEQTAYNLTTETTDNYTSDFNCKSIIFCIGDIAKAFSKCYLLSDSSKPLLDVSYSSESSDDDLLLYGGNTKIQKNKVAASVYAIDSDVTMCEIPFSVPETMHVELLQIILKHIQCTDAFVLTSAPYVTFKGNVPTHQEPPILMCLTTSAYMSPPFVDIPHLQSPNFVSGIGGAVLTEFEIRKKPAFCVINYIESNILDFSNVQAYRKLTLISAFKKLINKDADCKLINYIKKHSSQSNLYT